MKQINLSKPVLTISECAFPLSRTGRRKMAYRYFLHKAEKEKQSDGRTYTEALLDALQSGNNNTQANILYHMVNVYQWIQRQFLVSRVDKTHNLEEVLHFLECRGLIFDSQTVNAVQNTLRQKRYPKA